MKNKLPTRCMNPECNKVISGNRYYCYGCFQALEEASRVAEEQGDKDYEGEQE